jgi:hypothetical protein
LVEHLVCNQVVVGSSPVASTTALPQMLEIAHEQFGFGQTFFENKVNGHDRGSHNNEQVVKLLRVYGGCLGVQSR